jgi:hypothetical protein
MKGGILVAGMPMSFGGRPTYCPRFCARLRPSAARVVLRARQCGVTVCESRGFLLLENSLLSRVQREPVFNCRRRVPFQRSCSRPPQGAHSSQAGLDLRTGISRSRSR